MNNPMVLVDGVYSRRLHPFSATVTQRLRPLSSAEFVLPEIDEINALDWVAIETPDSKVEYYRAQNVSTDMSRGEKSVYLEHGACTLGDTIIPDDENRKGTISSLMSYVIGKQSRWTLGRVEATDTIYVELGLSTLLECINTIMESIPAYQANFVQESANNWYVEIVKRPTKIACEARLSRNLDSCEVAYDASAICTRVYSEGLTNGKMDSDKIAQYGIHEESMMLDDNLSKAQKTAIVKSYLDAHDHPAVSVDISGRELSQITGLPIDMFAVGTLCRVAVPWLGVTETEVILDKTYTDPYNEPESVRVSLANDRPDLSLSVAAVSRGGGAGGRNTKKVEKRFETHFSQTDQYFRLLATDKEWKEMEEYGTLTAYGQILLTSTSFENTVAAIGEDGAITAASIVGSINKYGSNIRIAADTIDIDGIIERLNSKTVTAGNLTSNGMIWCKGQGYFDYNISAGGTVSGNVVSSVNGFELRGETATWQHTQVVTSVSVARLWTSSRYIALTDSSMSGITGAAQANPINTVTAPTKTIYYLGRE